MISDRYLVEAALSMLVDVMISDMEWGGAP